jgi:hypothetical protein
VAKEEPKIEWVMISQKLEIPLPSPKRTKGRGKEFFIILIAEHQEGGIHG